MPNQIIVGQSKLLKSTFTVLGVATDPTSITLDIINPANEQVNYTYAGGDLTKDSTGTYERNVTFDSQGTWRWRWAGTGACTAACEDSISVRRSEFV